MPAALAMLLPMSFDLPATVDLLLRLLNTPSPTGFTEGAIQLLEAELDSLGVAHARTKKGALTWEIAGTGAGHTTFSGPPSRGT